jgi:hypothetical protein
MLSSSPFPHFCRQHLSSALACNEPDGLAPAVTPAAHPKSKPLQNAESLRKIHPLKSVIKIPCGKLIR